MMEDKQNFAAKIILSISNWNNFYGHSKMLLRKLNVVDCRQRWEKIGMDG